MANQTTGISALQMTIRPYVTLDREGLLDLINQLCAEGRWMYTNEFIPTPMWLHALTEPTCHCHLLLVVYASDIQLVGWCNLLPSEKAAGEVVLGMGLASAYREQGIGSAMLEAALVWAHQASVTKISLLVRSDNQRAKHLYQKFDFTLLGNSEPPLSALGEWLAMERMAPFVPYAPP